MANLHPVSSTHSFGPAGKTDVNPEGLTCVTGRHAEAFAARLRAGGLSCKVLDGTAYRQSMLEKLVWISAFMGVGARHKATVGEARQRGCLRQAGRGTAGERQAWRIVACRWSPPTGPRCRR